MGDINKGLKYEKSKVSSFDVLSVTHASVTKKFMPVSIDGIKDVSKRLADEIVKKLENIDKRYEIITSFLWRGGYDIHYLTTKYLEENGIDIFDSFPILVSSYTTENRRERKVKVEIPSDLIEAVSNNRDFVNVTIDDILDSKMSVGEFVKYFYERTALNFPYHLIGTPYHKSKTNETKNDFIYRKINGVEFLVGVDLKSCNRHDKIREQIDIIDVPSDVWISMPHELISVNPFRSSEEYKDIDEDREIALKLNYLLKGDVIGDIIYKREKSYGRFGDLDDNFMYNSFRLGMSIVDELHDHDNVYLISLDYGSMTGMTVKEVLDFSRFMGYRDVDVYHTAVIRSRRSGKFYNGIEAIKNIERGIAHDPDKDHIVYILSDNGDFNNMMKRKMGKNYGKLEIRTYSSI